MNVNPNLEYTPEVREALETGRPVVALESTIVSHGMPYPQNVQTAREVEETVRLHGVAPATIAVIGGRIKVGLSADELEQLGSATPTPRSHSSHLARSTAAACSGLSTLRGEAKAERRL